MPGPVKALLDANVLYSNHLRNLLLQMAQNDLFDVGGASASVPIWRPATVTSRQSQCLPKYVFYVLSRN
jgi:hypothetical protein